MVENKMAGATGLEPATSGVTGRRECSRIKARFDSSPGNSRNKARDSTPGPAGVEPKKGGPRPLSAHAIAELTDLADNGPQPGCGINPGVKDRLFREDLVEATFLPSPFPIHKGRNIQHLRITAAGRAALARDERR